MTPLAAFAVVVAVSLVAQGVRRPHPRVLARVIVGVLGAAVLFVATGTGVADAARHNFAVHMVQHVVLMFAVPMALVVSGASRSWWWLLPVAFRRRVVRWYYRRHRRRTPRAWVGFIALNVVMVGSHVPAVLDALVPRWWGVNLVLDPAYLVAGLLFFRCLVRSGVRVTRTRLRDQAVMVVASMGVMFVLAVSMAVFTKTAWYHVPGEVRGFDFHYQQLGAGILWICGDFWAVPLLAVIVRRVIRRDGSLLRTLEGRLPSALVE